MSIRDWSSSINIFHLTPIFIKVIDLQVILVAAHLETDHHQELIEEDPHQIQVSSTNNCQNILIMPVHHYIVLPLSNHAVKQRNICDTIKGNESHVEDFPF